jgi:heme/copper-type cytochrome/quinol oxidase subunit 2
MVAGMRVRQVLVVAGVVIIAALAAIVVREEAVKKETSVLPVRDPTVPVQVEARGIDRAWHFSYPGADGILNTGDDIVSVGDAARRRRCADSAPQCRLHLRFLVSGPPSEGNRRPGSGICAQLWHGSRC